MKIQPRQFVVIYYDDQQGLTVLMAWDTDCDGALCGNASPTTPAAVFSSRRAASQAIDISAKFAALNKAMGKVFIDDFLGDSRKNIRIIPLHDQPNKPRP